MPLVFGSIKCDFSPLTYLSELCINLRVATSKQVVVKPLSGLCKSLSSLNDYFKAATIFISIERLS
jgi:hypothetical protein